MVQWLRAADITAGPCLYSWAFPQTTAVRLPLDFGRQVSHWRSIQRSHVSLQKQEAAWPMGHAASRLTKY